MENEYRELGREFTKGILDALALPILAIVAVSLIYGYFIQPVDDSDVSKFDRSGLRIHTDAKTGIEYLSTADGALIPRIEKGE